MRMFMPSIIALLLSNSILIDLKTKVVNWGQVDCCDHGSPTGVPLLHYYWNISSRFKDDLMGKNLVSLLTDLSLNLLTSWNLGLPLNISNTSPMCLDTKYVFYFQWKESSILRLLQQCSKTYLLLILMTTWLQNFGDCPTLFQALNKTANLPLLPCVEEY